MNTEKHWGTQGARDRQGHWTLGNTGQHKRPELSSATVGWRLHATIVHQPGAKGNYFWGEPYLAPLEPRPAGTIRCPRQLEPREITFRTHPSPGQLGLRETTFRLYPRLIKLNNPGKNPNATNIQGICRITTSYITKRSPHPKEVKK